MSEVLVMDMEMPETCSECPFVEFSSVPMEHKGYSPTYCKRTLRVLAKPELTKPDDCPIREVKTPHGDLIDRDELLKHAYYPYSYEEQRYVDKMIVDDFDINEAKAIVEANNQLCSKL